VNLAEAEANYSCLQVAHVSRDARTFTLCCVARRSRRWRSPTSHLCDRGALSDEYTNPDIRFFPILYGILSFWAT
jgi:hypothetical protein